MNQEKDVPSAETPKYKKIWTKEELSKPREALADTQEIAIVAIKSCWPDAIKISKRSDNRLHIDR